MDERQKKAEILARQVLELSRNSLMISMRFMDTALCRMDFVPDEMLDRAEGTDGVTFRFQPMRLLQNYRNEQSVPVRSYLHVILHCIFQHPFVGKNIDQKVWDLACDIAVENVIHSMNLSAVSVRKESTQKEVLKTLSGELKLLTAEKLYRCLINKHLTDEESTRLRELFSSDSHMYWYCQKKQDQDQNQNQNREDASAGKNKDTKRQNQEKGRGRKRGDRSSESQEDGKNLKRQNGAGRGQGREETDSEESDSAEDGKKKKKSDASGSSDGQNREDQEEDKGEGNDKRGDAEQNAGEGGQMPEPGNWRVEPEKASSVWNSVAEHVKTDLETFSREAGKEAGDFFQSLQEVTREKVSYEAFLKQFSVYGEVMKQSEDEFDYIYYTYGLSQYKNMPLIEPLEYQELKRIREFVIAIDTSGSVSGELVQLFVQKTCNILLQEESFFRKVNIHIIQCDAEIQEDKKITSREEFESYIQTMELHGFGGTDFRPVFRFVEELRKKHEFTNLKGLIYFTDGYGVFPERMPDYRTAFVFVKDEYQEMSVPAWAVKLVLEKDEIREGGDG